AQTVPSISNKMVRFMVQHLPATVSPQSQTRYEMVTIGVPDWSRLSHVPAARRAGGLSLPRTFQRPA
ncbi:MAG TPA: hypothetical protein VI136_11590, partial [Verrucomicrobiae bacterium]